MKVSLLNEPTTEFTDWAIGECYDKGCYPAGDKRSNRIERVANVNKHSSVLEFSHAVFEVEASTKVLLEMTRHRHASYGCKSTRYTLNRSALVFEGTGDSEIDKILEVLRLDILRQVEKGKKNDVTSLMLPQAYQYRWVVEFNYRSLQNFLGLRTAKHTHFHIRQVALEMYKALPEKHKSLFREVVYDKHIS